MTPRYIDSNLAKAQFTGNFQDSYSPEEAKAMIDEVPTADVAPVRHGHWYFTEYEYFTCSVCGKSYYNGCESSEEARSGLENGDVFDFCPHCGAKMDEGLNR